MTPKYAVHVSNISPSTTKQKLHDFFSFCGRIEDIDFDEKDREATVYFEKPNAVTTAKMLNEGVLDSSKLIVTAEEPGPAAHHEAPPEAEVRQEDKPRAGIAAEYLAKGYVLSDQILHRAIQIDREKGISSKFLDLVNHLDTTIGQKALGPEKTVSGKVQETYKTAIERAKSIDEQKGYSQKVFSHLKAAAESPLWQRVKQFYGDTAKQVQDIHEEAKRLAEHSKKSEEGTKTKQPVEKHTEQPAEKPAEAAGATSASAPSK